MPNTAQKEAILRKAALQAARKLELSTPEICRALGISDEELEECNSNKTTPVLASQQYMSAAILVRIYQSLASRFGGNQHDMASWVRHSNSALNARPIELLGTIEGQERVIQYLETAD